MTQTDLSNPIFTGIRLAEAVGAGDGAAIRKISSDVTSDVIQANGTQIFITTFLLLNQLNKKDFPDDVWNELPNFLIKDIKDRSVILGCSEELLHGMVASFLKQNVYLAVEGEKSKLLNPEAYSAGYFHISAAIGESIYALIKVAAEKRFDGNYKLAKSLITDYLAITAEATADGAR